MRIKEYYTNQFGRFITADPYMASAAPKNPQSWARYAYVQNDPINYNDLTGMLLDEVSAGGLCGDDWIFDASLSGPCGTAPSFGSVVTPLDIQQGRAVTTMDQLEQTGYIADWDFANGSTNQVQITLNSGLILFIPTIAAPQVAKPPNSGYWAYLSCFLTELAAINVKNPEVPGVSLWAIAQGLVTGAAWGPGVAVVGGINNNRRFLQQREPSRARLRKVYRVHALDTTVILFL
jgi:hypothetical protein